MIDPEVPQFIPLKWTLPQIFCVTESTFFSVVVEFFNNTIENIPLMRIRWYSGLTKTWLVGETNPNPNIVKYITCHSYFFPNIRGSGYFKTPFVAQIFSLFQNDIMSPIWWHQGNLVTKMLLYFSSYFYVVDDSSKIISLSGDSSETSTRKIRVWKGKKPFTLCRMNIALQNYLRCYTVYKLQVCWLMHL